MAASGSTPDLGSSTFVDDDGTLISTTDVELLKCAFGNEILSYEAALVHRLKEQIELAEQTLEVSEANGEDPLTIRRYRMDLDWTTFMLRSYLRLNLQKIEEDLVHILKTDDSFNGLSKLEQAFAKRCIYNLEARLKQTVLSKLPDDSESELKQSISSKEDDTGNESSRHCFDDNEDDASEKETYDTVSEELKIQIQNGLGPAIVCFAVNHDDGKFHEAGH